MVDLISHCYKFCLKDLTGPVCFCLPLKRARTPWVRKVVKIPFLSKGFEIYSTLSGAELILCSVKAISIFIYANWHIKKGCDSFGVL